MKEQKNLANYRKIGSYQASSNKTEAELVMHAGDTDVVRRGPLFGIRRDDEKGDAYYFAEVSFSKRVIKVMYGIAYPTKVSLNYGASWIPNIFNALKSLEEHIEELLEPSDSSEDWRVSREVLRCIFELERQVKESGLERSIQK